MEIDAAALARIQSANPGDYAVCRVVQDALHLLACSPGLPALSGMTPEEYEACTETDVAAIFVEADRPLVRAKLSTFLQDGDPAAVLPLAFRILHKTSGFLWMRARVRRMGTAQGVPVILLSFSPLDAATEYAALLDHAGISIYVIDRQSYELLYVNRAALEASGNRSYQNAMCFRYFNGLDAPCPWCALRQGQDGPHTGENYVPPLSRWYRHDTWDIQWYGREATVFYVTNITEQKQREKLEAERFANLYRQIAAANPNALALFRLNLTQNLCSDAQSPYEAARRQQSAGTADGYLAACGALIADDKIRQDFLTQFTLPNILQAFQNGVTELSLAYPIRASSGDTIWVNGFLAMTQNAVSGDVEGIAYAINITDQRVNSSILARISEEKYDHIGLINPAAGSYELRKQDGAYGLAPHQRVSYQAAFEDILRHYICPEDRDLFYEHGKLEHIVARLNRQSMDAFVYRCFSDTGGYRYKQVKYAWLDDHRDLIMETQTDLTALYENQLEQVKRQHEAELAKKRALSAESIPAGIGVLDFSDGVLCLKDLNQGFFQMIGGTRKAYEKFSQTNLIQAVLAEDRPGLLREVRDAIREKRQLRCRFRLLDGAGRYPWAEVVANHVPLNSKTERFYAAFYDVDELIRTRSALQEKELIFRDILTHSDILHFTYYPDRHRYEAEILPVRLQKLPKTMDGYPDSFIRYIGLSTVDARAYRDMVHRIDSGMPEAECTVRMYYEGKSGWYRVHMLSMRDGDGRTVKAIGNVFNVDRTVEAERAIADERLRVESLQGVYLATACFNVTKDTEVTFNKDESLSRCVSIDADALAQARKVEPNLDRQHPETLSILLSAAWQIPDEAQRKSFLRCFSHEGMLRLFRAGRRDVVLEYRRLLGGELVWMSTQVILMAEPYTGDILAFYYTRDISQQKKTELIAKRTLEINCDFVALVTVAKRTLQFRNIAPGEEALLRLDGWRRDGENDYQKNVRTFADRMSAGKDAASLFEQFSLDRIVLALEQASEYSVSYDRSAPDNTVRRKQVQYRWLDETKTEILMLQSDITAAYIQELERTRQLQKALDDAKRANRAKTEFISRISHDIRTPISAITNMTAFAREDLDDREKLLHDLSRIEVSNTFLLSLINDVLDISKIDSGKIELHPAPYAFREFIDSIHSIFQPLCQQSGLTFRIAGASEPDGRSVMVDHIRYNQIALNLLSNAVKYTPAGGTITYTSHSHKRPDGQIACGYTISDTGIGMSESFQKAMFEPFTQEHDNPERQRVTGGTGLGLSIVKRLVDLMGGEISVKSALGEGTHISVSFVLPEAPPEALTADPKAREHAPEDTLSGTVLLVEDNAINTEIAVRILGTLGLQTIHAENGQQAVERFQASPPGQFCAILMDIQMPIQNGYEATRAIRALPRPDAQRVPIIAMTADAFEESIREAMCSGMNDYVAKPIDPQTLYTVLQAQMQGAAAGPKA